MAKKENKVKDKDLKLSFEQKEGGKAVSGEPKSKERRDFVKTGLSGIALLPYVVPAIISYTVTSSYAQSQGRGLAVAAAARAQAAANRTSPLP